MSKSKFENKKIRDGVLVNLRGGASKQDAANLAGVSPFTVIQWRTIGEAILAGEPHERIPDDEEMCEAYAQFAQDYKKAETEHRVRNVSNIQRLGLQSWRHNATGLIRLEPPPPVTWYNKNTGEVVFKEPTGSKGKKSQWVHELSGRAWSYDKGNFYSSAWLLERGFPEQYALTLKHNIQGLDELVEAVKDMGLEVSTFFMSLASELRGNSQDSSE